MTGCEDGSLIVWGNEGSIEQEHSDFIFCLETCKDNILISGSKDGWVIVWSHEFNNIIPIHKINIRSRDKMSNKVIKSSNKLISHKVIMEQNWRFEIQNIDVI